MNNVRLPIPDIICSIENAISHLSSTAKDEIRNKSCNILTNFKNKKKLKLSNNELNKNIKKTKQFLKENPNLLVLKPDKSNKTVIMESADYINKMNNMLNDTNLYQKIKNDPTTLYKKKTML